MKKKYISPSVQKEAGIYVLYNYDMTELDENGEIHETEDGYSDASYSSLFSTPDNTSLYDIYRGKGKLKSSFKYETMEEDVKLGNHYLTWDGKKYVLRLTGYTLFPVKDYIIGDGSMYDEEFGDIAEKDHVYAEVFTWDGIKSKTLIYEIQDKNIIAEIIEEKNK